VTLSVFRRDPVPLGGPLGSARVTLDAAWTAADAESYRYFDRGSQTLSTKARGIAGYASGGSFDTEATGRSETDTATVTGNTWTAPEGPASVRFRIVLRDSRGGVDVTSEDVGISP
jgi:hypothetical protein